MAVLKRWALIQGALLIPSWFSTSLAVPVSDQQVFSSTHDGTRGAVACENRICSEIGITILKEGGNAADAMVATNLCVGVVGMYHSGIGGGGFMLIRDKDGRKESLDYRETAPAAAFEDMFRDDERASEKGGLAVAVPGELRGLEYIHKKYGVLPWSMLVMPAVHVARRGFRVNEDMIRYMKATMRLDGDFLVSNPAWAEDFAPNGRLLEVGETMTRKRYANTLEKIAQQGPEVFYKGEIVSTVNAANGSMTLDDIKHYQVSVKAPLSVDYRGYKLFTTEAPSSGAVTLEMLKIMEQYPLEDTRDTNLTLHRLVEAMKFAYGARLELGDPAYVNFIDVLQKKMLSEEKAKHLRDIIKDNETQPTDVYNPDSVYTADGHGTSHIVTSDGSGMTISSTTTVNLLFGAQIITPDTGIILNDQMNDFSIPGRRNAFGFPPSPANFVRPGKRPLSSITPVLAEHANGTVFFATGAAGGSRIISSTAQVAWRVLDTGVSMHAAVAAPRLHDQLVPDELWVERAFGDAVLAGFVARRHNATWVDDPMSAVQGVLRRWDGSFEAASETRQRNSAGLTL